MLPELEAERQLRAIEAASVPHMTPSSRMNILTRWGRRGRREKPQSAAEELAKLPIRVIQVPKKVKR